MRVIYLKEKVSVDVVQVTTMDERFYHIPIANKFFPSSTWIASYIKKDAAFIRWYAEHGYDEAEAIRQAAGNKGSKVHQAVHDFAQHKTIAMDAKYINNITGNPEELSVDEYDAVVSFARWYNEEKPKIVNTEMVVLNEKVGYAGTLDLIVEIRGQAYIIDVKTSANIYLEHILQVSSYLHTFNNPEDYKLAILQVGYSRNKKEYKFTEIEDKFHLFLAAMEFWRDDNPDAKPLQKDYPTFVRAFDAPPDLDEPKSDAEKPTETSALLPGGVRGESGLAIVGTRGGDAGTVGAEGARMGGQTEGITLNADIVQGELPIAHNHGSGPSMVIPARKRKAT